MGILDAPALSPADAQTKYIGKDLPTNAGTRTKFYNPQTNVYNKKASNTRKLRSKLATAYAGAGLAKLGFIGDSKTAGQSVAYSTESWPMRLRAMLIAQGHTSGGGVVIGNNNYVPGDSRWTFTGAWVRNTVDKPSATINVSGATALFTSDSAGTIVDIHTYGTTAAFTYSIDGAAAVTITPNGTSALQTITVTGLANTTHTVLITTTSSATTFITDAGVRNTTGLWIANLAIGGSKSSDWNSSAYYQNRYLASNLGLDVAFISLGANDARNSVSPATYKTNMQGLIGALQAGGTEIHLVVQTPPNTATITAALWDSFVSAQYDLADQYDVPLVDLSHRYGSWVTANALGLFTDDLHENKAGYTMNAVGVKALLD